ncbi:S8/S53 family peptidase [Pseudenhygromyxa sp. WMMC2535]|uniref:S8/S53 family peptidase n=1 Tax=Pseudenhygromyxa sp. WMMC2535 TaxID=2712867 RepID=UPI0015516DAD|nr:S8/S53 family peptidase [Pseudenhygromyxa sp. WMMC2535]NVB40721.1 S8/S53 family peptidase [Pseudenhygromyxa sp. WMMC2535]
MRTIERLLACTLLTSGCAVDEAGLLDGSEGLYAPYELDAGLDPTPEPGETAGSPASVSTGTNAESQAMAIITALADCPGSNRLIGILENDTIECDLDGTIPKYWSATPLFSSGSPALEALSPSLPAELARYCVYDYVGPEDELESDGYAALFEAVASSSQMPLNSLGADCRGQFGQSNLYDASVGAELEQAFMANIGWAEGEDIDLASPTRARVEVAVLDTVSPEVASDPELQPNNAHGLHMAALIRAIDCPAQRSECLDDVRSVLALPRADWDAAADWTRGGKLGTHADLAMAVFEAAASWRQRRETDPKGTPPRLVINLSLGWNLLGDASTDLTRGPAASTLAAMRYASCSGALMLAAAGNTPDELCPELHAGPLAPASFEELPAPSLSECAAMGFLSDDPYPIFADADADTGAYVPLTHAVGARDEFDQSLLNSRPESTPRLVALGTNAVLDANGAGDSLSGTSVSTAVASATAALLWSYQPKLRPDEVMQLIYASGWNTGALADFDLLGESPEVHRLSVCAALDAACEAGSASCPTLACAAEPPAVDGNLSGLMTAVNAVLTSPQTNIDGYELDEDGKAPVCEESAPLNNLATTQPDIPICSRCNLTIKAGSTVRDDQLSMTIVSSYAGSLASVRLITADVLGQPEYRDLDSLVVASLNAQPDPVDVTTVTLEASDAVSASLQFTLLNGAVYSNVIPILEE